LEGHPNNAGQHAAGIVITEEPILDYVAVDSRTKATMCDKIDAEELNMLKIDALGLTQLSIFERTLELIGVPPKAGWLERLPTDDQAAFDVLNNGKFSGIFQFNGLALQSVTKQVHIDKFDDLVHITALARPGPMASGNASLWVKRRNGTKPIEYPHPAFEPQLKDTLGVVMYQEQVMQIGREIGGLSWEDVTALRKAMSKSLGKEFFDQYGDRWKSKARDNGIPDSVLDEVWDDLCAYGSWSFNKSHAVAYGMVSYWCLWLKAHHPIEFAAATLDAEHLPERQIQLLRELKEEGVDYVPIDSDHSIDRWTVATRDGKKILIGPLTAVHGIGPKNMQTILTARKKGEPLPEGIAAKLRTAKTDISTLYPIHDKVHEVCEGDLGKFNIITPPKPIKEVQCGLEGDIVIIGVLSKIAPKDENEEVNVAKRGGRRLSGPTKALNLFVRDDSDEIFCKIERHQFEQIGNKVVEYGKPGKAIYAIKGPIPKDFRMIKVKSIRHLCDLDGASLAPERGGRSETLNTNAGITVMED
jgi:hypothetical protein